MQTIKELLDTTKAVKGVASDYALAKLLGLPTQRISDYYKGHRVPDEFACLRIAEALGKDYAEISAAVRIEAEKDENRKEAWRRYYKSIGGVAASFMLMVLAGVLSVTFFVTSDVHAQERQGFATSKIDFSQHSTNYAFFWSKLYAHLRGVFSEILRCVLVFRVGQLAA